MFENVSEIEGILSELERDPFKLTDDSIFEQFVQLRRLAISNWDHARPDDPETPELCHLRDRIVGIEQRVLRLAVRAPAHSIDAIRLKLLLWILDQHIQLDTNDHETVADRLIASVFHDITRLSEADRALSKPHQRPSFHVVK